MGDAGEVTATDRGTPRDGRARASAAAERPPQAPAPLVLAEAKLAPPRLADGLVAREAILGSLLDTRPGRVVLVVAPPGYGKTTLLSQWRARERRPVAWLTASPLDVDPVVLLTYLATAIDRAVGLDPAILDLLTREGVSAFSTAIPRLTSELHRMDPQLLVVIDDVQVVAGSASADALAMLLEYLPSGVEVALAGRHDVELPTARLRASGRLLELTARDLALDDDEWAKAVGVDRLEPASTGHRLYLSTEGWPVAAYLLGRATRLGAEPDAAASAVARFRHDVGAYIDAELLAQLAPEDRDFLLRTSVLERMNGRLCDAMLGRTGSAAVLDRLSGTTAMVIPLEGEGAWYRYHSLLREHLRDRVVRDGLAMTAFGRRAADWLVAEGMADQAVEQLFAVGDADGAGHLISTHAMSAYRSGRAVTLTRWIDRLGEAELQRRPYLATFAAWVHLLRGEASLAFRMADLGDDVEGPDDDGAGAGSADAARLAARAIMARAGFATAVHDAELAVAIEPKGGTWRPTSVVLLGCILAVAGDPERAERSLREAEEISPAVGADRTQATALNWQAMLAIERDQWLEAARLMDRAIAASAPFRHEPDITGAGVAALAARVAIRRNDPAEARRQLSAFQASRLALGIATPWFSVRILLEASLAYLALADPAGARAVLRSAEDVIHHRPDLGPLPAAVEAVQSRIRRLPPGPGGASTLTVAELRVLRFLPTYLSVPQMADRLSVAPSTVRTQVQAIYGKLGAASRGEAVEVAIEAGLLEPLPVLVEDATVPRG